MIAGLSGVWAGVLFAVGSVYLLVGLRARRVWTEPGGESFSGIGVALAFGAWFGAVGVALGNSHEWSLFIVAAEALLLLLPALWVTFAARRAGVSWLTRRRTAMATLAFVLLAAQNRIARLFLDGPGSGGPPSPEYILAVFVPMMVAYLVSSSLLVFGTALIGRQALAYDHVPAVPSVALSVGVLAPWLTTWFSGLLLSGSGQSTAAWVLVAGFGVGALGFVLAYERFGLFEDSAAAGTIGRDRVVETMEDAVVVVDERGHVLDFNPAADQLFGASHQAATGRPIREVVGEPIPTLRTADVVELSTVFGRREFEPTASAVTGVDGRRLGDSVVLRDVTERRTREQRLAVLNRVLRHNLRNEMSVVSGYAELLGDEPRDANDQLAEEIAASARELVEIGEKARTIEELMSEPPVTPGETRVETVVEGAVAPLEGRTSADAFELAVPEGLTVEANPRVLRPAIENLVENAVEHNDSREPRVEIRAERDPDGEMVTITVVDNGPGIPDQERAVLESGDVTPLEHGSGLGLWVAKWGATRLGGALSLAAAEPRGTVATVRVPRSVPETTPSVAPAGGRTSESA